MWYSELGSEMTITKVDLDKGCFAGWYCSAVGKLKRSTLYVAASTWMGGHWDGLLAGKTSTTMHIAQLPGPDRMQSLLT